MPVYSPPVTRQRARALIIAQQQQKQQKQQIDRREDEQRKLQPEQARGRDRRLRPQQQQQQRSVTGKKAEEAGGRSSEPEKAFSKRRGAEVESSRPRTRGASHARGAGGVEGSVGSLAAAETRPATAGTLGNSASRWCIKGVSRSTRRGGGDGGGRNPIPNSDANSTNTAGESVDTRETASREGQGETMIEAAAAPRNVLVSPSSPASDVHGVAGEQPPRAEAGGPAAGGADGAEADELSPLLSCTLSPPASIQQPLEEVNPSVLNTKANGNRNCSGSSSGNSNSGRGRGDISGESSGDSVSAGGGRGVGFGVGVGIGGEVGTGKGGGDSAGGGGITAAVVGGDGRADDGGRGSVAGGEEGSAAAAAAAPDADAKDSAAENSTADRHRGGVFSDGGRNATESCVDRRGTVVDGSVSAEPRGTDGGVEVCGSQRGSAAAAAAAAAGDGVGVMAPRAREKSIDTEEDSTGVISPVQKRNRRELKLSEEETAMAGAPQGPVYQVQVLDAGDFERSPNPEEEMQAILVAAGGGGDWADLYSAVDSTRRLCIFHSGVLVRQGNLEGAVGLMVTAVGNLRSSMVRNALLGVGDMFRLLGQEMGKVDIRAMVAGTLQRLAGEKRFICNTAAQAMEAAARSGPGMEVLHATLPSIHDRNAEVSSKSAFFAEKCLAVLGVGSKAGVGLPSGLEFHSLMVGLAKAFSGKLPEGRMAGRRGLLRSRKAMGPGPFEAALAESLGKAGAASILPALTAPNRDAGSTRTGNVGKGGGGGFPGGVGGYSRGRGGAGAASAGGGGRSSAAAGRPSIREQMMAAKRKKQEEEKQKRAAKADGPGDRATNDEAADFVIVT